MAEQIQLLASLLQDNRKQQRAFEDLARSGTASNSWINRPLRSRKSLPRPRKNANN